MRRIALPLFLMLMSTVSAFGQFFSGTPQLRYIGTSAVAANTPVSKQDCTGNPYNCVQPATSNSIIIGLAITAGTNPGDVVYVIMNGFGDCNFDTSLTSASVGNLVFATDSGLCHDSGIQNIYLVPNTTNILGSLNVLRSSSTVAAVNVIGPATQGRRIQISTIDSGQLTTYIQANQTAQVNADWNATSGVAQILNKPSIPAAQVNSDWNAVSGLPLILNKPALASVATTGAYSSLTGTPTLAAVATTGAYSSLSGTPSLATVATSGNYTDLINKPTIPSGTVTSFSASSASWPSWLVPGVTTSTTTPALAVTASAIPNAALANTGTTVNGQTCTLGSSCTIAVGTGTITGITTSSPLAGSGTSGSVALSCPTCVTSVPITAVAGSAPISVSTASGTATVSCSTCVTSQNVTYYNTSGVITGAKHIVSGPITTSSSGAWTFNYSTASCSTVYSVQVRAVSPTGTLATQQYSAYMNTPTTTVVSGTVYSGAVLSLLGATLIPITAATTVYAETVCT